MLFAVTDIETTGGYASAAGITEVAIVVTDGETVVERYQTLINPGVAIPPYITSLTGINNAMVASAPYFDEVAAQIYSVLQGKVFVAHNVNFDFSFLKHHLGQSGYELNEKKLCTVRYGKKVVPGLPSYSLGNFCRHLGIENTARHRAGGDCEATFTLLQLLMSQDADHKHLSDFLKKTSKEQSLPLHLDKENITQLPYCPGVYYFHDQKDKIIYVGKARNIRKRVLSHFTNNNSSRQRQEFVRNIYRISCRPLATELMAFIFESIEIKRLWPRYNSSQKRFEHQYGIYVFEDQRGLLRLGIEKKRKITQPVFDIRTLVDGYSRMWRLIEEHQLCPRLCHLDRRCQHQIDQAEVCVCGGACTGAISMELYNERVKQALAGLQSEKTSFYIVDAGMTLAERSCILVQDGAFYGMGYMPAAIAEQQPAHVTDYLEPYPANHFINSLLQGYAVANPKRVISI